MIKILTGWSKPGGSTRAFIELVNAFNAKGQEAVLYGPDPWHMRWCNGAVFQFNSKFDFLHPNDVVIMHFLPFDFPGGKHPFKKLVYSCHETEVGPIQNIPYKQFDFIHYVSNFQRDWHGVPYPNVVIPNIVQDLDNLCKKPNANVAGIVGSIDSNKRTHIAIKKALEDGCSEVLLFGLVTDPLYFNDKVAPLIEAHPNVSLMGYEPDSQHMYNQIDVVYHLSKLETYNLVYAECKQTGTRYVGSKTSIVDCEYWSSDKIIGVWNQCLQI